MLATAKSTAKEICFSAIQCWDIQKLPLTPGFCVKWKLNISMNAYNEEKTLLN